MLWGLKIAVAAGVIAFSSWLAGKRPELAGFIVALPLTSVLALVFARLEHGDAASIRFAQSILTGVPLSLVFFLPFIVAGKYPLPFWLCFVLGLVLLAGGYWLHQRWMGA